MTSSNFMSWRWLASAMIAVATASSGLSASAQDAWPVRPIKLIVPFAPGGSTDVVARVLANKLGARLGQPVIVDYKSGAGGTIGANFVAKSPADGYTLLLGSTTMITAATTGVKLPYDTVKDLAPIGQIGSTALVIVVAKDSKYTTLRELIDDGRARPDSIHYGTGGVGSMTHLGMELFSAEARAKFKHVPYRGVSLVFSDIIGGSVQTTMPAIASVAGLIEGGKLRPLAITSSQRAPFWPSVPTVAEAALPGFEIEFWWGLMGPARLPAGVTKRLSEELNAVLAQPDLRETLAREATYVKPGTPEKLGTLISSELARWGKLVKDANITVE